MALHVQCETPRAVFVLAVTCSDGILRFPEDGSPWPGLGIKVNTLLGINAQLKARAVQALGDWGHRCDIWQEYSALLNRDGIEPTTLYVGRISPNEEELKTLPWQTWQTLPALIRTLPKDRNRLSYLKAWQVLSGALEENTKALDVDEVARYLKSLEKGE